MPVLTDSTRSNSPLLYALPDITARGRFSKSHLYALLARGHFPKAALVLGPRFTRWSAVEVDQWFADPARWIAEHTEQKATA
jgi:predicted DNA-binding transcriptional regulator AlpA